MASTAYQLLKFLISFSVPWLVTVVEPGATLFTKSLMGVAIFIAWSMLDILYYLRKIQADAKRHTELWSMEHDLDVILNNIRQHYREIVKDFYGPDDLFKDYFQVRLAEIADFLQSAAERKELHVTDFHFQRTELLLAAFANDDSGILRYVWIIRKGDPLFDDKWCHYCDQILKGTTRGAIKGVRALLVLGEGVSKDDRVIQGIAGFYDSAKGHSYKVMEEATYKHLKSDNRLETDYIDFGIYGQRYIYLTLAYGELTSGIFCKDKHIIDRYTRFFDVAWNSHSATKLSRAVLPKVTLDEFFRLTW